MPTLTELTQLIETHGGSIEWMHYMRAHQEVKGYLPLPQLKTQIKFCHPEDVFKTLHNLQISYAALESTKPSFLIRKKQRDDMQLMESILKSFQDALEELQRSPRPNSEWSNYF